MTRLPHRTLLVVLVIASAIPRTVLAQATAAPRAPDEPHAEALASQERQEREVLAAAEQLATEAEQLIEQWIASQTITEARMFARLYFPIPSTDPQKYSTSYDKLAERDLVAPEDKTLARSPALLYAILTDINGYVPAHNTRFAQQLTEDNAQNYITNRTKRILGDPASLLAARSEAHHLLQRTKVETGDVIYDLSVPVTVRGKHWGCARIGYRRTE